MSIVHGRDACGRSAVTRVITSSSPCVLALLGMLYAEEKERLDFVYTIYHWWQAIAIFVVYLWWGLPMRVCGSVFVVFGFASVFFSVPVLTPCVFVLPL